MNGTDTIRDFARVGVRLKLGEIQSVLEELYRDFPEEFTQKPQVVAVNGHRPLVGQTVVMHRPRRRPARRRPVSAATLVRAVERAASKPWGALAWQRIHDYLAQQPKMTARAADIRKAVKVSDPMVYSITEKRPDLFARVKPGVFVLKHKAHTL